jgi:hypothetical protein
MYADVDLNSSALAKNVGTTGYDGQSGWFVSAGALASALPFNYTAADRSSGADQTIPMGVDAYASLTLADFSSWQSVLARASEVADLPGYCLNGDGSPRWGDTGFQSENSAFYCDATTGIAEWYVDDGRCCPRSATARTASAHCSAEVGSGAAIGQPPDCIALISGYPNDQDDNRNRCAHAARSHGPTTHPTLCDDPPAPTHFPAPVMGGTHPTFPAFPRTRPLHAPPLLSQHEPLQVWSAD